VLERHAAYRGAVVLVANEAHEARERPDIGASLRERVELTSRVEIRFLYPNARHR
jgi:hypothetical protein